MTYGGGCACGALRFECTSAPLESGYCHCWTCQKTSAAPVLAFVSFAIADFNYVSGEPSIFRSSEHGRREYCRECGTQIAYRDAHGAQSIEVNSCSLDEPAGVIPSYHIWYRSRVPWFSIDDLLPRYDKGKPDD